MVREKSKQIIWFSASKQIGNLNNRMRSVSLGEQHHSQGWTHGSWWQVVRESGKDSSVIAVGSTDSSPDGSESFIFLAWSFFVNINNSLSVIVAGSRSIIDSFKVEDALVCVLLNFGSSEPNKFGSYPKTNLLTRASAGNRFGFGSNFWHGITMVVNKFDY